MAVTAGERLRRMLAMVPWIVAHPGVPVAEAAQRFGVSEKDLVADLHVIWMVGLPPYSPDSLVDVVIEEGRVWINYADFFSRPLRLTPDQGLNILTASDALLSLPGTDPEGPLSRALAKLAEVLGVEAGEVLEVDLGVAEGEHLSLLREAASSGTEVEIDYYSYGRDEHTRRVIAPWRVMSSQGAWYVEAWCHRAQGERLFRLDRIERATDTGKASVQRPIPIESGDGVFHPRPGDARFTVRLEPDATWVIDTYPCERVERHNDGSATVELVVSTPRWLERLALVLGDTMTVIDGDDLDQFRQSLRESVDRMLERYQGDTQQER